MTPASNVVSITQAGFDDFWNLVPTHRRQRRKATESVWRRITGPGYRASLDLRNGEFEAAELKAAPDQIIAGWKQHLDTQIVPSTRWDKTPAYKDGGQYVRSPLKWLCEGGWEDCT